MSKHTPGPWDYIAAAPELLEALKAMLEIEGWDTAHPRYAAARAAIAKAKNGA
jgi:hypothetical protein